MLPKLQKGPFPLYNFDQMLSLAIPPFGGKSIIELQFPTTIERLQSYIHLLCIIYTTSAYKTVVFQLPLHMWFSHSHLKVPV